MARETTSYGFGVTTLVVAPGVSNALLVYPQPNQVSMALKFYSGGSMEIFRCTPGSTTPAVAIATNGGYPLGDTEIINSTGAPRFFLAANGATATAKLLLGLSDS